MGADVLFLKVQQRSNGGCDMSLGLLLPFGQHLHALLVSQALLHGPSELPDAGYIGLEVDQLLPLLAFLPTKVHPHDLILADTDDSLESQDVHGHFLHLLVYLMREIIEIIKVGVPILKESDELLSLRPYFVLQISVVILEDVS